MKNKLIITFAFSLLLCGRSFAQTPQPLSAIYIACPSVTVKIGFFHDDAIEYWWYSAVTGGTLMAPSARDNFDIQKNYLPAQTVYAEPRINGVPQPRIPVELRLSEICGKTDADYNNPNDPASSSCYKTGTLLFKQDFGGNSPSDPFVLPNQAAVNAAGIFYPNEQVAQGWTYLANLCGWGVYSIGKQTPAAWYDGCRPTWGVMDDHTYYESDPQTPQRGYFISFEAENTPGRVFYEMQIDNLCIGTELTFSAWIRSMLKNDHTDHTNLIFRAYDINDNELATYFTGNVPDGTSGTNPLRPWANYGFTFATPTNSVKIKITNNGGTQGNDFGMDDIEVHICTPPILLNAMNVRTCVGSQIDIHSSFSNNNGSGGHYFTEPLEYQWYYSQSGDMSNMGSWTAVPTQTDANLDITQMAITDTGYYYLAIAGAGGIDYTNCRASSPSVHIGLGINIEQTRNVKICGGSYNFYGDIYSNSVTGIQKTINNPAGCDSLITLNLTVNQPFNETVPPLVICDKELPYSWRDTIFAVGTTSKQIIFNKKTRADCDSIVTLDITVNPAYDQTEELSLCTSELPKVWRDTVFDVGTTSGQFVFHRLTAGCDSIVRLNVEVKNCNQINIFPPSEICADDASFSLQYDILEGTLPCYTVAFDQKAKDAGFEDISCATAATGTTIEIPIPQFSTTINCNGTDHQNYVKPDNYSLTISFQLGNDESIYTIPFTVLYPKWILEQNWEDVIAILNKNCNGGYEFSAYEWYLDNSKIEYETKSYYYVKDGGKLNFGHEYRVALTRKNEEPIFTCAIVPQANSAPDEKIPEIHINSAQHIISINAAQNGVLRIFNIAGVLVKTEPLAAGTNSYSPLLPSGMYILQIILDDGARKSFKIVL
ncbi:MAG: T9SS type A sorting domain-containing protein [Prevotellaceae bacterium]|jgi:hypothetical protein|nr:T9SS type A sorting domain-containing protein [Prevotellaceae bacterium]